LPDPLKLNERGLAAAQPLLSLPAEFRVSLHKAGCGATLVDCGVKAPGGQAAGRILAEVCLAGLGSVRIAPGGSQAWSGPVATIATDHPVAACMASQYAGWELKGDKFFAMGSGPMRAAGSREKLFEQIDYRERPAAAIGVVESGKLPPDETVAEIAEACGVAPEQLTLLCARTASLAGTIQVVARSVETALHKMHELEFPLEQVVSGFGAAPLPPVAGDDLTGVGRTNDAMLYGGEVTLWVQCDDEALTAIGPRIPSNASADHGRPFKAIFESYDCDFYKIDPFLFSPAVITLNNLRTGRIFRYGKLAPEVLQESFTEGERI